MNFTKVFKNFLFKRNVLNAAYYEDKHLLRRQLNESKSVEERITDCFDASRWLTFFSTARPSDSPNDSTEKPWWNFGPAPIRQEDVVGAFEMLQKGSLLSLLSFQFITHISGGFSPVIGGSMAAMSYSVGRATKDCDINIALNETDYVKFAEFLKLHPQVTALKDLVVGRIGEDQVPVAMTSFRYNNTSIDVFFNSNWASSYAIENSRKFNVQNQDFRFIPPESVCLFKFANAKKKFERYSVSLVSFKISFCMSIFFLLC